MLLLKNTNRIMARFFASLVVGIFLICGATGAANAACGANEIDVLGDGTQCETAEFSVTTTNNTIKFIFSLSAVGTFYVDWGDGSAQIINRTNTTSTEYSHNYATVGSYTIKFGGTATNYNTSTSTAAISFYKNSDGTQDKIASISGNLSAMFPYKTGNAATGAQPRFYQTFRGTRITSIPDTLFANYTTGADSMFFATFYDCTSLRSIPSGLFSGITTGADSMFQQTFQNCISIESIPGTLFSGITTGAQYMFYATFYGCTSLESIPAGLFSGITTGADSMFKSTFYGCISLESIPAGLFSGITTGADSMFFATFNGCTSLRSIPSGLFSGITTGAGSMFSYTFYGCTGLSDGYIQPNTFHSGLTGTNLWNNTFYNTGLLTTCPTGTTEGSTEYKGSYTSSSNKWGNYVICEQSSAVAVTLDNTGVDTPTSSTTVYLKYIDGWYSDSGATNTITSITPPTKSGYAFLGYYTAQNGAGVRVIDRVGKFITTNINTTTLYPYFVLSSDLENEYKFTVTTTNDTSKFIFRLSAVGTFYVNWGDGDVQKIVRTNTTSTEYLHNYATAGSYTIQFGGTATNYNTSTSTAAIRFTNSASKIASISGNLSAMFPYKTGNAATGAQPRFYWTFFGASNLTSIPGTLFANYTTGANYMFSGTFYGCTSLTSIPGNLFSGITTGASSMFSGTFYGCTSLESIPAGLFSGITTGASSMFTSTFDGCTGLSGSYIPPTTFHSGLTGNYLWSNTFNNTGLLTTCPIGTAEGSTEYKGTYGVDTNKWGNYVICYPTTALTITLDSQSVTTAAAPTTVYLKYNDGWYSDSGATTSISVLSTIPTKTDYVFGGFFTKQNSDGVQVVDADGRFITSKTVLTSIATDSTIYAHWGEHSYNVTYACGMDTTGTAPVTTTVVSGVQFTPAANTCSKSGYMFAGWGVSGTDDVVSGTPFAWNYNENKTLTAQWVEQKFSVTTTNDTNRFIFSLSAVGTFYVNWGDGDVQKIVRTNTTSTEYLHNYATAGSYTIQFGGTATNYNTSTSTAAISFYKSSGGTQDKITSISGNLSAIFPYKTGNTASGAQPRFYQTFQGTSITSIPDTLFANYTTGAQKMFQSTFYGCTSLRSIPGNLFSGITTGANSTFRYTFQNCTSLELIPGTLFSGITTGADYMFYGTFSDCTSLESIPGTLFSGITTGANYMFSETFDGCTGLTSIPAGLFSGITTGASYMFRYTFQNCTSLTGYVPLTLFRSGLTGSSLMSNIFYNTGLATSCPAKYIQHITGYESYWNGKVSCELAPVYEIELDATGATTNVSPSRVYLSYKSGWYSDNPVDTPIYTLSTVPQKTNYGFFGFYTGQNGTGTQVIDKNGQFLTTSAALSSTDTDTTVYALFKQPYNVSYSCGSGSGVAPVNDFAGYGVNFVPAAPGGCTKSGYMFAGWGVSGTDDVVSGAFTWNYNSDKTLTAQWAQGDFFVTTTELSSGESVGFSLLAAGSFNIAWGDGTVETVVNDDVDSVDLYHTYESDGVYRISLGGRATGYAGSDQAVIRFDSMNDKITRIDGSLGAIFPTLGDEWGEQPGFMYTFASCYNLTSIPENLFTGITGGAPLMFVGTFENCSSLESIPGTLFSGITTGADAMFAETFMSCYGLTSIPPGLFSGISNDAPDMFAVTFAGCDNITGYIPPSTFAGLIANGSPSENYMWSDTFGGTQLATSCSEFGLSEYTTGYEEYWDSRVSCYPATPITCVAGQYFDGNEMRCVACKQNNYCPGGTYTYDGTDLGINGCPNGLYSPASMSSSEQCGHILHIGDNLVYLRSVQKTTPSLNVQIGNTVFYGNLTTSDVSMTNGSNAKLKVNYDNTTYSVYDDSVDVGE